MNDYQKLWWEQAKSDFSVFVLLSKQPVSPCHLLHYLQMSTEKLLKAYLWSSGSSSPKSHKGIVSLLRLWNSIHKEKKQQRIAKVFSSLKYNKFQNRIRWIMPIAHGLENLAPTLADKGPNTEYPWPHESPTHAPVNHDFAEWKMLETPCGRDLLRVIRIGIEKLPEYADL